MNTTGLINETVKQRIADFHDYLNLGMSLEAAKKIVLESTCYTAVKTYIENYKENTDEN